MQWFLTSSIIIFPFRLHRSTTSHKNEFISPIFYSISSASPVFKYHFYITIDDLTWLRVLHTNARFHLLESFNSLIGCKFQVLKTYIPIIYGFIPVLFSFHFLTIHYRRFLNHCFNYSFQTYLYAEWCSKHMFIYWKLLNNSFPTRHTFTTEFIYELDTSFNKAYHPTPPSNFWFHLTSSFVLLTYLFLLWYIFFFCNNFMTNV